MTPKELDKLAKELANIDTAEAVERPPAAARIVIRGADD